MANSLESQMHIGHNDSRAFERITRTPCMGMYDTTRTNGIQIARTLEPKCVQIPY